MEDVGFNNGQTIWNNGYNYQNPSFTEDLNSGKFASAFGLDQVFGGIWNDITGVTAQSREFAQQEYLQDKMNAYNHPVEEMKRQKEAGINPNLTASGIAQAGSQSAQAPAVASNTSGASQGLSAVGSALGGISSAALTSAQRRNLDADSHQKTIEAKRTDALLSFEEDKFRADIAKTWIDAGMDKHMSDYWSVKAAYADRQEWLDVQGKLWSISKVQQEISNLEKEYEAQIEKIKILKEQVSQEEYRTKMMAVDSWFKDERKRIYLSVGVDPDQTEEGMLIEAYHNGQSDFILGAYEEKANRVSKGNLDAVRNQLREQMQIEWEENLKGRAKQLEQDKEFQKEMMEIGIKGGAISTVVQTVLKYIFGTGFSVNIRGIGVTNNEPTR